MNVEPLESRLAQAERELTRAGRERHQADFDLKMAQTRLSAAVNDSMRAIDNIWALRVALAKQRSAA